jgi:hypothetical protein
MYNEFDMFSLKFILKSSQKSLNASLFSVIIRFNWTGTKDSASGSYFFGFLSVVTSSTFGISGGSSVFNSTLSSSYS